MIYVISDIHGHTKTFERFLSTLNHDDFVYVLRDVIDKGDGTLDVLRYIMSDNRFQLLLGNHDYLLYSCAYWSRKLDESKNFEYKYYECYDNLRDVWEIASCNDTLRTYKSFLKLSKSEQSDILDYLRALPVQLEVSVDRRDFLLVHSRPVENHKYFKNGSIMFKDFAVDDMSIFQLIWDREYYSEYKDMIVVTRHNCNPITFNHSFVESDGVYENEDFYKNTTGRKEFLSKCIDEPTWLRIDCRLAMNSYEKSKLGILCLNDLSFSVLMDDSQELLHPL